MNLETFWKLIEEVRQQTDGVRDIPPALELRLSTMPVEEITSYDEHFCGRMDEAYDNRLWAAAFVICGGCSNDGFTDFRGWLIARGKEIYDRALTDPDSLCDVYDPISDDTGGQLEAMISVAFGAYVRKTGCDDYEPPTSPYPALKHEEIWDGDEKAETLSRIVPRLVEKCHAIPDEETIMCRPFRPCGFFGWFTQAAGLG